MIKIKVIIITMIIVLFTGCIYSANYKEKSEKGRIKVTVKIKRNSYEKSQTPFNEFDYVKFWLLSKNEGESFSIIATQNERDDSDVIYNSKVFNDNSTGFFEKNCIIDANLTKDSLEDYIIEDVPTDISYIAVGIPGSGYGVEIFEINGMVEAGQEYELNIGEDIVLMPRKANQLEIKCVPEMFGADNLDRISVKGKDDTKDISLTDNDGDGRYTCIIENTPSGLYNYTLYPESTDIDWKSEDKSALYLFADEYEEYSSSIVNKKTDSLYTPEVLLADDEIKAGEKKEIIIHIDFSSYLLVSEEEKKNNIGVVLSIKDSKGTDVKIGTDSLGLDIEEMQMDYIENDTGRRYKSEILIPEGNYEVLTAYITIVDTKGNLYEEQFPLVVNH